jgi:hypothetical protein
LEIVASGPTLREYFARRPFTGTVEPGRVLFNFLWIELPYLVENLQARILAIDGIAELTGSNRLSGTFAGSFWVFERLLEPSFFPDPAVAWCYSQRHRFELSR